MLRDYLHGMTFGLLAWTAIGLSGCATSLWGNKGCSDGNCSTGVCSDGSCASCNDGGSKWKFKGFGRKNKSCSQCEGCGECGDSCTDCAVSGKKCKRRGCKSCGDGCGKCGGFCGGCCGLCASRSLAIPDEYPLGTVMRAHIHQMQTNGEAADFILFQMDFVGQTAELTPDGKDKVLEMAARMRSAPYPVVIERTWNNADPELDAHRRNLVAQILTDLGNGDANTRVFVSPSYGPGKHSMDAMLEFWQYTYQGYGGGIGGFGGGGFGGGFGGGGFGGGFGGGGFGGGGFF